MHNTSVTKCPMGEKHVVLAASNPDLGVLNRPLSCWLCVGAEDFLVRCCFSLIDNPGGSDEASCRR